MGAQSIGSPGIEAAHGRTLETTTKRVRRRLQLLQALTAEIEALKRDPEAQRRLRINDPADTAAARSATNIAE